MLNGTANAADNKLQTLAERFSEWRAMRCHRSEPIPGALWDEAVRLCEELPISRVVHALRLSGGELKKRCQARAASASSPAPAEGFIELTPTRTPSIEPLVEASVELRRADGASLSIRTPANALPLGELIGAFLAKQ